MIWIPRILWGWIGLVLAGTLSGCRWVDADQPLRSSSILLEPGRSVAQTIVARHAGLAGVEVWLELERRTVGTVKSNVVQFLGWLQRDTEGWP